MIHVIATIDIKPGTREIFLEAVRALVPDVRAEEGCIAYGPAVDVRADVRRQMPFRENTVTIVERWESLDALKAHLTAPHMAVYREKVKDCVVDAKLQILEPV